MPRKSHKGKPAPEAKNDKEARESVRREVAALGKEVADTLRAVAESEQLRAVSSELTHSMKRLSAKVVEAVKTAGKSERPRAVAHQIGKVAETGRRRGMEAGERLRNNLSTGLRQIGEELSRLAQRLDK
ncbi:MAG: hypothetical protein HY553_04485 [Elusimicrobia bacterium]|nr:hypothetical protein [Elusimicrobiota bacterium]